MFSYAGCSGLTAAQCHPGRPGRLARETYTARSDFYDRRCQRPASTPCSPRSSASARAGRRRGQRRTDRPGRRGQPPLPDRDRLRPPPLPLPRPVPRLGRPLHHQPGSTHPRGLRRYASGAAYQNYTDPALTAWRTAYYGSAAARLTELKKKYDPDSNW